MVFRSADPSMPATFFAEAAAAAGVSGGTVLSLRNWIAAALQTEAGIGTGQGGPVRADAAASAGAPASPGLAPAAPSSKRPDNAAAAAGFPSSTGAGAGGGGAEATGATDGGVPGAGPIVG